MPAARAPARRRTRASGGGGSASSCRGLLGAEELIALAAARADPRGAPGRVDLAAQPLHVDVDHVGRLIVGLVPHMPGNVGAADHLAVMPREMLEQRELARRQ